jgi:hypothetical protein
MTKQVEYNLQKLIKDTRFDLLAKVGQISYPHSPLFKEGLK